MNNKNAIIEIKNLFKKFGDVEANSNISFNIYDGERIGIIGANGAGKTTLVEQIIGIIKPTSGQINYNFSFNKSPQEQMGMQFQDSSYPDGLNVKDIIEFSMEIYGVKFSHKKLEQLLNKFQIKSFYKAKAKGLSGGQQQKLNVLLAIIHNPKVVILDEISTGLDILAREEIINYVEWIVKQNNTTTILISHNMDEIEKLCERIVILQKGKVVKIAKIDDIKKQYLNLNNYMHQFLQKGVKNGHN